MAKYQRQGTNKYYGAANAGYVATGSSVDGLAKSLQTAGFQIGKAEDLRIDRKKDAAIAKIDEMVANGKSFETIQAEIIKGDHPELTGKYIDATTNYHAGRVKAEEVKNNIVAAQNNGEYDITDESSNLDMFFKKFMPDTKSMDTSTLLGFTSNFNEFRATAVTQDAENRAGQALKKKNEEGIKILDGIQTSELKSKLPSFIEKLQIPLPSRDGSNKSNLLYTNEETMNVLKDSVRFLIADAKTEEDLDRVDILLNTNLGYSKKGSAIGTLASRKSDEMNAIKKDLDRTRRTLISNDREDESRARADRIKDLTTKMLVNKVEETDENGNVTTRKMNFAEKQVLLNKIRQEGSMELTASFAKMMTTNPYFDNDPEVFNNLIVMIRDDQIEDREAIAKLINDNNIAPANQSKLYEAYDNSLEDDNKRLHLINNSYVNGTQAVNNKLAQMLAPLLAANEDKSLLKVATDSVNAHLIVEIYDFEKDYYEDAKANGKKRLKPTNEERTAFMKRKLDDVERQYKDAQGVIDMKTFDEQAVDAFNENEKQLEKSLKDEEQRQKDNTVISTGEDGEAITLSGYVDTVLQNFNVVEPPKIREAVLTGVIKATKDKTAEEVAFEKIQLPKIKRYITSIFGTTLNQEVIDMMSKKNLETIIENIAGNLEMDKTDRNAKSQIANIIKSIIGE